MRNQLQTLKIKKYFFMKNYVLSLKNMMGSVVKGIRLKNDDLEIKTTANNLSALLYFLQKHTLCQYTQLIEIACLDIPGKKRRFMLNYLLLSLRYNARLKIVLQINEVGSLFSTINLYRSANWLEREVWDLYGIFFEFHSNLTRILTDYSFPGHALRKDFPLTGFLEASYDARIKKLSYEPVELAQEFRTFNTQSPWIQKEKILSQLRLGSNIKQSQWVSFKHENILSIAEITKIFLRWLFKQRSQSSGGQSQGHPSPKKPGNNSGQTPEAPKPSPENQKKPTDHVVKVPESPKLPPEDSKKSSENSPENSVKLSPEFDDDSAPLIEKIKNKEEQDRWAAENKAKRRSEQDLAIKNQREKEDKERQDQIQARANARAEIDRKERQALEENQTTRRQISIEKEQWKLEDDTEERKVQDQNLQNERDREDSICREEKISWSESLWSWNRIRNDSLTHKKEKIARDKSKNSKNQIEDQTQNEWEKSKITEEKRIKKEDALLQDLINEIKKK